MLLCQLRNCCVLLYFCCESTAGTMHWFTELFLGKQSKLSNFKREAFLVFGEDTLEFDAVQGEANLWIFQCHQIVLVAGYHSPNRGSCSDVLWCTNTCMYSSPEPLKAKTTVAVVEDNSGSLLAICNRDFCTSSWGFVDVFQNRERAQCKGCSVKFVSWQVLVDCSVLLERMDSR